MSKTSSIKQRLPLAAGSLAPAGSAQAKLGIGSAAARCAEMGTQITLRTGYK